MERQKNSKGINKILKGEGSKLKWQDWIAVIGFIMTAGGLIISIISMIKIQNVKNAQKEAQKKYAELVRVQEIKNLLQKLNNFFRRLERNTDISKTVRDNLNITGYTSEIATNIATIDAINRAFNNGDKNEPDSKKRDSQLIPVYAESGYYNNDFFNNIILKAQSDVVICCKRNTRISQQENVQKLCALARQGREIKIVAISPDMPDALLAEICESVPNPSSLKELKESQLHQRQTLLNNAKSLKVSDKNLQYYETNKIPFFHLVKVDDKVYWGLVNYKKYGEDLTTTYEERPYLVFDAQNLFAIRMLQKVEDIIKESKLFKINDSGQEGQE